MIAKASLHSFLLVFLYISKGNSLYFFSPHGIPQGLLNVHVSNLDFLVAKYRAKLMQVACAKEGSKLP